MATNPGFRDELKQATWRTMVSYAVFRIESALTIALILVLVFVLPSPFPGWQWWYWVAIGVIAEGLIVYTSLTDPETHRRVVAEMLREEFDPGSIRNPRYRQRLERALDYRNRMQELVDSSRSEILRERLQAALRNVDEWTANMYRVSARLDAFDSDRVIAQDTKTVPAELATLEKRLTAENDAGVRGHIQEALNSKRAQLKSLEDLHGMMESAELQLDRTLSDLGNIYSQLRQIEAKDIESGRAQRIADDIDDQVNMLRDIVQSMDEVYASRTA